MCGIFGMVGKNNVVPMVFNGISNLEYRGYDSAGIAYIKNNKISCVKQTGEISNLQKSINFNKEISNICIAHTRWATHGKPTINNAHPFVTKNGKFCLVHNGIIENYLELKKGLSGFTSETDSEVILKLIEKHYNGDMLKTLNKVCNMLKGSFALAIICSDYKNQIFVAKRVSPCVVGICAEGAKVCSDINGIGKVNYAYVLNNDNFAVVSLNEIKIYNNNLEQINLKKVKVSVQEKNGLGKFKHFMQKEIYEIPNSITNTLNYYSSFNLISKSLPVSLIKKTKNVIIVGCGTAYHAGLMGRKILEENSNINIKNEIASEFIYSNFTPQKNTLMFFVSQSGETADTIKALKIAKQKGLKTVAITNVKNSSICFEADYCLYTFAGNEVAVASTKAYVSQLVMFYLLSAYIKQINENLNCDMVVEIANNIRSLANNINVNILNKTASLIAQDIYKSQSLYMIGRNFDYVTALEASLKLKEISYIHSEAYPSGELKHGTISLIDSNTFVFAFLTDKKLIEKSVSNVNEIISRGAKVILVSQYNLNLSGAYKNIKLKQFADYFMPLNVIIIMQLIAYHVSLLLGLNPDKPRALAKSVTVE